MPSTVKVLLDTDIGDDIDDALALAYLVCQPRCELLGVTTVWAEPSRRAEMVSAICHHVGKDDVAIHPGASSPLFAEQAHLDRRVPQAAALGDWPRRREFEEGSAIPFMRQTILANPGEVTLIGIGPMTNIAALFAADPRLAGMLKGLVLMAGCFLNRNFGEYNVVSDAPAARVVYEHAAVTPPLHRSFGLDVTKQCVMDIAACRSRFTARALQPVRDFLEVWFQKRDTVTFHDPLAVACVFKPDICEYKRGDVRVGLVEPTKGWTVFRAGEQGRHEVAYAVKPAAFYEHFFQTIHAAD